MSISFRYDDQDLGVILTCVGDFNCEDLIGVNQQLHQTEKFNQLQYYLLDLSGAGSVDVSADKLRYLAEQLEYAIELGSDLKIAVVSDHDVINSLIKMWHTYLEAGGELFQHFEVLSEAYTWVAMPPSVKTVDNVVGGISK